MPPPLTNEQRASAYLQADAAASVVDHWGAAAALVASVAYHYCKEDTADTADTAASTVGTAVGIPPRFLASVAVAIVVAYHTDRYSSCLPLTNMLALNIAYQVFHPAIPIYASSSLIASGVTQGALYLHEACPTL